MNWICRKARGQTTCLYIPSGEENASGLTLQNTAGFVQFYPVLRKGWRLHYI